jgi:SAM-dependent methyltransferase
VTAGRKFAVDLNPDAAKHLASGITFFNAPATDLSIIGHEVADVVFTSNFLEHLRDKKECDTVLAAVRDVLKPGGKFIVMGPNIRFTYREYWDFYDHYLPLSDLSLGEGLGIAGFRIEESIARFMPYTMNNKTPTHDLLVRAYLALPLAWKVLGKQFLIVAVKK